MMLVDRHLLEWVKYLLTEIKAATVDFNRRRFLLNAPREGLEPSTSPLTAGCSTIELPGKDCAQRPAWNLGEGPIL